MTEGLDLTPSPRLLEILGDIPFKPWQCVAELVDNAFDAFSSGSDVGAAPEPPTVWVQTPRPGDAEDPDAIVRVADNGPGMDRATLERSLRAGYSGNPRYGSLGLFGMGFNIATARLGRRVEVSTTAAGDQTWTSVTIDFREMRERGGFQVPVRFRAKDNPAISGTEVAVSQLTQETRGAFRKSGQIKSLREQLGRVYSYMLRTEPIPGVPHSEAQGRGYVIKLNDRVVGPRVPCVWSADRVVVAGGIEVPAVITVDHRLATAYACQSCGHWHTVAVDICGECDSEDIQPRERRIHGWLGIQRYIDDSDFGIDFLRGGRKILIGDKRIFTWEDPSGLSTQVEYPLEAPARKGRIVGEIHLDHVTVTYQKNDFQRDTREWIDVVRLLRGEGPLQPQIARRLGYDRPNTSPLAKLFAAYRRNDGGTRSLTPGDGSHALHEKARQWGNAFHNGQPDYQTDEFWYAAALEHDRIKQGLRDSTPSEGDDDLRNRLGLGGPDSGSAPKHPASGHVEPSGDEEDGGDDVPEPPETEQQRFDRYRANARPLPGIDGQISLGRHARKEVRAYGTEETLTDVDGDRVPCVAHTLRGNDIEVFVELEHPVFVEYGRDPRDFAIMEIASALCTLTSEKMTFAAATADVIRQFPDQRFNDSAIRERAETLVGDMRAALGGLWPDANSSGPNVSDLWAALSVTAKEATEARAARVSADMDWASATRDGVFIEYLDAAAIAELVRALPAALMDGHVLRGRYSGWSSEETRARVAERAARLLDTVSEYLSDPAARPAGELRLIQVTLDNLAAAVVSEG